MSGHFRIYCGRRAAIFFVLVSVLSCSFAAQTLHAETHVGDDAAYTAENIFPTHRAVSVTPFAVAITAAILFAVISIILLFLCTYLFRVARKQRSALRRMSERRETMYSSVLPYVSHEIRTPLSAVVGITESMDTEYILPAPVKERVAQINSFMHYALRIVDNALVIKRFAVKKQVLVPVPFSLPVLLKETEDIIRAKAASRGILFFPQIKITHEVFVGDSMRIEQILLNLLTNAVKFTPEGGQVCLFVKETAPDPTHSDLLFRIIDNGIGICKEDHRRIFEIYEQAGNATGSEHGIGLGLVICKELIENMGGRLEMESEPGKGSTFYFTIRLEKSTENVTGQNPVSVLKNSLAGIRVLLAEDNELIADITAQMLKGQGASVLYAENGTAALDRFVKSGFGEIDVVLMDVRMPGMDGFAAAAEIRALGRPDSDVPIIAVSAGLMHEESAMAEAVGIDTFLVKPISAERLCETVHSVIRRENEKTPRQTLWQQEE